MSYILNQYNHAKGIDTKQEFLTLVTNGIAKRKSTKADSQVIGNAGLQFLDECVYIPGGLKRGVNYYFHGRIKRMKGDIPQTFDIKLVNYDDETEKEQFIKTIVIVGGETESEWVNVDFIFTPIVDFDTILFKLYRDSNLKDRYPIIIYEELSIINNILSKILKLENQPLIKIGIQSNPGLLMCINGQSIMIGKSGIYELRNGIIKVNTFSVVNPADETEIDIENLQNNLANMGANPINTTSICIFNKPKIRTINNFIFDYMYEREE